MTAVSKRCGQRNPVFSIPAWLLSNRLLTYGSHAGRIMMETFVVTISVLLLALGVMFWGLSAGTVNISFAQRYIAEALHDPDTDTDVSIDKVLLSWPVLNGPLQLTLHNATLERRGRRVVSIDNLALGLSTRHLLVGRIEPISIRLQHPVLGLIRTEDNHFQLSLRPESNGEPDSNPMTDVINALTAPKTKKHSPLAALRTLQIDDATLILEDHAAGLTWYLQNVNFLFGRDRLGLAINAGLRLPGGLHGKSTLTLDGVYGRDQGDIRFNLHMSDFDLASGAGALKQLDFLSGQKLVVNGNLSGQLDKSMALQSLALNLTGEGGTLDLDGLYDYPLLYNHMQMQAFYDGAAKTATLKRLQLTTKGVTVQAAADMAIVKNGLKASINLNVPQILQAQIEPLWPDALRGDGSEIWLTKKLSSGSARNMAVHFDVDADHAQTPVPLTPDSVGPPVPDTIKQSPWHVAVKNMVADFDISGATVDYRAPLTPVVNASGHGNYKNGDLNIDINQGLIDDIDVGGSHVLLQNIIHAREGVATINIKAAGPLKSVFRYIRNEPISLDQDKLPFDADAVKGSAQLGVQVSFPTIRDLKADQVKVTLDGTLSDVLIPKIVSGMDLTGGPFRLSVADAAAHIDGKGQLGGTDMNFDLVQFVKLEGHPYASRITAAMNADDAMRVRFGVNLSQWLTGPVPVNIVYTALGDHRSTIDVKADLTQATLAADPVGYVKQPGVTGEMGCTVSMVAGAVTGIDQLHLKTPDLLLDQGQLFFDRINGKDVLRQVKLPLAHLGETNLALNVLLSDNGQVKVDATGPFLDATYFLTSKKKSQTGQPPLIATVAVDTMRTGPGRALGKVRLLFNRARGGGFNEVGLTGNVGRSPVSFTLKPNAEGRMTMRLSADDAGGVLRAFDIYKNAVGGKLLVQGQAPDATHRDIIIGHAQITDFRIANAPVLAKLLNSLSLVGLPQLLGGQGIHFSELQGDFEWHMRPEGDLYVIKGGRTSGASLGLTFAGSVDKEQNLTDVNGTIIPISGVNGLVGRIPVLGNLLTNGGALFAFTYSIKGPSDDPAISVNPLAALAPGFLRDIFFKTK